MAKRMISQLCVGGPVVDCSSVLLWPGTLQDGFSMRKNLDYTDTITGAVTEANFMGWGLCRGLQAFLDIKEAGSRERSNPPLASAGGFDATYVNPACVATGRCLQHRVGAGDILQGAAGNPNHANIYAVFSVHPLAVLHALCNLPRYLR
jgi:hypothetical protein